MSDCHHSGFYSGIGMYSKDSQSLRYVLICDDCGDEMKELSTLEYSPDPVTPAEIQALA
jgi:hypothetical protein